ncbi:MAG TPA: membrane protein insertase YidC, partial [Gemmatimonadales bacterium]|nr:membrane protein insertase YidC [Gemmatimonadales bacterium]
VIWAIALMLFIAVAPSFFFKQPPRKPVATQPSPDTAVQPRPATPALQPAPGGDAVESVARPEQLITVSSPLYQHRISTRGGAIRQVTIEKYSSLNPAEKGRKVELLPDTARINQLAILVGQETIDLSLWDFTPSAGSLEVTRPDSLVLTGTRNGITVRLAYHFRPDDYQVGVTGQATGLGPVGGHLSIDMGQGMRQTEADSNANFYDYGVVTKTDESSLLRFSKLKAGETRTLSGPFEWAAVKSKYFVTAVLTLQENGPRLGGVTVKGGPSEQRVHHAAVSFGMPVDASGMFAYTLYAGPMEYPRLKAIGHDFYDINPYGWPGFRTLIRPIAVGARWLLVYLHEHLALAYGLVLIVFGVGIRILLWPLNQKGMRAGLRMQAIQPEMQRIQDKYKNDPQQLQRQMMELYKREGVNPFSGCWPMLLPWPILLALFFVFQNTIELRGQSFLWFPDLSLKDPLFILPVLMGLSMFGLSKVGMQGVPPTPQTKVMLYFMPIMMTVMFLNFASGLNLYYFVQNLASIPQQWMLARERKRHQAANAVVVNTKPGGGGKKK